MSAPDFAALLEQQGPQHAAERADLLRRRNELDQQQAAFDLREQARLRAAEILASEPSLLDAEADDTLEKIELEYNEISIEKRRAKLDVEEAATWKRKAEIDEHQAAREAKRRENERVLSVSFVCLPRLCDV